MKIFLADGRLGNQIFQYVFLKTIQDNNEKIIVSGFEDLENIFEINDIINLNKKNKWVRRFLYRIIRPLFNFLADLKIISSISVNTEKVFKNYERETTKYTHTKGFIKFFTFVKLGFFQSEYFFDKSIAKNLKLKKKYLSKADIFLKSIPDDSYKIFIHVRRADYKNYYVCGASSLVPLSFFKDQIEWFLKNKKKCFFIILTDEYTFIKNKFNYVENKKISKNNHFGIDMAIMTLCNSAILSPSSFGWWGSYMMKNRDVVFVPKYWLGFNAGVEYPKNSVPSYSEEKVIK
jgi:hypothetical protein